MANHLSCSLSRLVGLVSFIVGGVSGNRRGLQVDLGRRFLQLEVIRRSQRSSRGQARGGDQEQRNRAGNQSRRTRFHQRCAVTAGLGSSHDHLISALTQRTEQSLPPDGVLEQCPAQCGQQNDQ